MRNWLPRVDLSWVRSPKSTRNWSNSESSFSQWPVSSKSRKSDYRHEVSIRARGWTMRDFTRSVLGRVAFSSDGGRILQTGIQDATNLRLSAQLHCSHYFSSANLLPSILSDQWPNDLAQMLSFWGLHGSVTCHCPQIFHSYDFGNTDVLINNKMESSWRF